MGRGVDWFNLTQVQVANCCEHGDEPSGSIKLGEFLDSLMNCQLLKNVSAAWN